MIPDKQYKLEHLLQILRRRRWLAVVPCVLTGLGTWIWAQSLPNEYQSEAVVLIVPQRVSENYVRSTISSRVEDRLQSISQQNLSRPRLEQIILDFNLYPEYRANGITDRVISRLREDISILIARTDRGRDDAATFTVSYVSQSPETAMQVTDRLASLFIDQNVREREDLARSTSQFFDAELEDTRQRLVEHEEKLESYRNRYGGELPSQVQSNLQVIQSTETQIQNLLESLNPDRDRQLELKRLIAEQGEPLPVLAPNGAPAPSIFDLLLAAEAERAALTTRLKPEHPDVVRVTRQIEELQKKAASAETARVDPPSDGAASLTLAEIDRRRQVGELEAELEQLDRQMAYKETDERRLRTIVAEHRRRVDAAPRRESELITLTRDYDTLQQVYKNLLAKREDSKISANLEDRRVGEQFRLMEAPRLPQTPFGPDRTGLMLRGLLYGLAFGLGLVGLAEYRDTTLKTDEDVLTALNLPVLAIIPIMTTASDLLRLRRRKILASCAALAVIAMSAAVVWTLAYN